MRICLSAFAPAVLSSVSDARIAFLLRLAGTNAACASETFSFPAVPCASSHGVRWFSSPPAVTSLRVRPLHGYWDSPEISSAFPWRQRPDTGSRVLPCRRALLRRYTGYSLVGLIILCGTGGVKECQGSVPKMFFIE